MGELAVLIDEIVQVLEEIEWEETDPIDGIKKIKDLCETFLAERGE